MSITNKVFLAVTFILGATSVALAQGFDPNLGNRIPALNGPGVYGYPPGGVGGATLLPAAPFQSEMVGLYARPYNVMRSAPVAHYAPRLHRRTYQGAFQSAPVGLNIPPPSVVQPDNYQYWRQACCL